MISLRVIPIGTSTRPTLLILPASAKTLVPFDVSLPIALNQEAPSKRIAGTFARVSTLLTHVGLSQRPLSAGNGGFVVGSPRCPSIEWIRAVSSPHTKAPAPYLISISKEKLVPIILSPSSPCSLASFIA